MTTRSLSLSILISLLLASAARADLPRPFPYNLFPRSDPRYDQRWGAHVQPVPNKLPITIALDPTGKRSRLVIPRKLLRDWHIAALNDRPKSLALAGFLAVGCCGLWFVSGRRRWGKPVAALAVLLTLCFGLGTVAVWARAQPPMRLPIPPMKYTDRVTIEVVEEGNEVRLILPAEQFRKNLQEDKPAQPRPASPAGSGS